MEQIPFCAQATKLHGELLGMHTSEHKEHSESLLNGSRDTLIPIAAKVGELAEVLQKEMKTAVSEYPSKTLAQILETNEALLIALCNTEKVFKERLRLLEKALSDRATRFAAGLELEASRRRMTTIDNNKRAEVILGFGQSLKEQSSKFNEIYNTFLKATGGKIERTNLGIPALDLVLYFSEMALHAHLGPIATLLDLLEKQGQTKERIDHPMAPAFASLFAMDALLEALTIVAIALRRLPTTVDSHGQQISVTLEAAQGDFQKSIEAATKERATAQR